VRPTGENPDAALERVRRAYREAAEELRRQQEALAAVHGVLMEISEEDLALHRRGLAVLDAMRRDLQEVKRRLQRLGTARA
jgi:hypothetical protein